MDLLEFIDWASERGSNTCTARKGDKAGEGPAVTNGLDGDAGGQEASADHRHATETASAKVVVLVDYPDSEEEDAKDAGHREDEEEGTMASDNRRELETFGEAGKERLEEEEDEEGDRTQSMSLEELEASATTASPAPGSGSQTSLVAENEGSDRSNAEQPSQGRSTRRRLPSWMVLTTDQLQEVFPSAIGLCLLRDAA